ncbi:glycosyltransferase family 4 protein [Pseudomonas sp. SWRI81]|uniref:MraY family glycosyltransferase n=1 Tax=Pseudomonas sp. SWRI81 TaxID=2745505 RepID=UPI001645F712|nr:glycosyltransferase family 4 protein [Pseudomonas sp. SWRI81]MBC3271399.1 glycosyltransferase family 4 protein [Pseudomonas sp. SWRI81]
MEYYFLWVPLIGGLSFALTLFLRRYALHQKLMDVPNSRSSHTVPTPRGGGVAFVLTYLASLSWAWWFSEVDTATLLSSAGAGALVAVIGFIDDHRHIAARWRLVGHFGAAILVIAPLAPFPTVSIMGVALDVGIMGLMLSAVYLVWMLNLYNFMDGIDGIAAVEAVTTCLGMVFLYSLSQHLELILAPVLLATCVGGFLFLNFPPAKIFMGDAGSGFLGVVLAGFSLQAAFKEPELIWPWLILMGVFIVDATFTLLRRLLRGDKVYEAHRSHAYQFASRQVGRHLPVTLCVGLINVFWLLPIAFCVMRLDFPGLAGVLLAYVPLVMIAIKYRAGALEGSIQAP